jgi:hypothetical protein
MVSCKARGGEAMYNDSKKASNNRYLSKFKPISLRVLPEDLLHAATGRPGVAMAVQKGGFARQMLMLLPGEDQDNQPRNADTISGGASVE